MAARSIKIIKYLIEHHARDEMNYNNKKFYYFKFILFYSVYYMVYSAHSE